MNANDLQKVAGALGLWVYTKPEDMDKYSDILVNVHENKPCSLEDTTGLMHWLDTPAGREAVRDGVRMLCKERGLSYYQAYHPTLPYCDRLQIDGSPEFDSPTEAENDLAALLWLWRQKGGE